MADKKSQPWKENANSLLVIYSILAATCGVIIALVFQDSQSNTLLSHWWVPVPLLGSSFWLFIFSADVLTTALDEDDIEKYLSLLVFYNIAVFCLLSGLFSAIYYHYIAIPFQHIISCHILRIVTLILFCIMISLHWLRDVFWLLFQNDSDYQNYIEELRGEANSTFDRKWGWSGLFIRIRKLLHKEVIYTFKETIIELKPSIIIGIGVFATKNINEGDVIAEGIHKSDYKNIIPWSAIRSLELDKDTVDRISAYCIGTPNGFFPPPDNDFNQLSVEWYMNHSCKGNIGFNKDGDFVAIRNIKKKEELTYDYGLAESNPKFKMACNCKTDTCRKIITGNDWKDETFRKKNLHFMLPELRK